MNEEGSRGKDWKEPRVDGKDTCGIYKVCVCVRGQEKNADGWPRKRLEKVKYKNQNGDIFKWKEEEGNEGALKVSNRPNFH